MNKLYCKWKNPAHPRPAKSELRRFCRRASVLAGLPDAFDWHLALEFVDDRLMTRRNRELLGHVGTTDVITCNYFEGEAPELLNGEVAIELIVNPDAAAREGSKRPQSGYSGEMALYLVHGLLHCAGADDLNPVSRRRMRRLERRVLSCLRTEFNFAALFPER